MIRLRAKAIFAGIMAAIAAVTLYTGNLSAQTENTPSAVDAEGISPWASLKDWDDGYYSSVALHTSGLFVEVHNGGDSGHTNSGLWYRIGKFDPVTGTVARGGSVNFNASYNTWWPSIAITREGYVVIVASDGGSKSSGKLKYYVGTLDPNGGINQRIVFKLQDQFYDTGYHGTVSINYNGIIAEAHEGDGSNRLFYRLGHLSSPGTNDFRIIWDTGSGGTPFDTGVNPFISLNDNGDVVEVHKSENGARTHYTRGKLAGNTIAFPNEHPWFDDGLSPSVALLNNGYVMEINVHTFTDKLGSTLYDLTYRLGLLDPNNSARINWLSHNVMWNVPRRAGLSTNGTYAMATPCSQAGFIKYTSAIAP